MNFGFGTILFRYTNRPWPDYCYTTNKSIYALECRFFNRLAEIRKEISDILNIISDADALLVDLRHNRGGDPLTVSFILS